MTRPINLMYQAAVKQDERGAVKMANNKLSVKVKKLTESAVVPKYAHDFDAGFDLVATEDVIIEPTETKLVKTGLAMSIPEGYELQIRPRSGVTLKTKLRVQLGTVDAGYRGEIGVIVDNTSTDNWSNAARLINNSYAEETRDKYRGYLIRKGDRIAQAVLNRVPQATFEVVESLDETERGAGGFGSTGVSE